MNKQVVYFISLLVFLLSCGNPKTELQQTEQVAQGDQTQEQVTEVIELDNGQKWKVEDHMMTHIRNMESEIINFKGNTLPDYQSLAVILQQHIDLLTSNCTMTGKAHDELHKWLLPYIELVQSFSKAESVQHRKRYVEQLKTTFITFNQYFQ